MTAAPVAPLPAVAFRAGARADHRRVFGDWLNSYATSAWAKAATPYEEWRAKGPARAFWDGHHELIERLLARADLLVACWPEDPTAIVGWLCSEPARRVLHYVAVKQNYRRVTVARRLIERVGLLDGAPVTYSHRSRACSELPIPANWKFDPYAALLEGA